MDPNPETIELPCGANEIRSSKELRDSRVVVVVVEEVMMVRSDYIRNIPPFVMMIVAVVVVALVMVVMAGIHSGSAGVN